MPKITIKTRVVRVVEAWAGLPSGGARPTNKKLKNLWIESRGLPYDTNAKRDLISRLRQEFSNFTLHLTTNSFDNEPIDTVQALADYIERL